VAEAVPTYASRDEIPDRYKWDLSSLFVSDEAFGEALSEAEAYVDMYAQWESKACSSAEDLLAYLRFDDEANIQLVRLVCYAGRRADEDTRQTKGQDMQAQVIALMTRIQAACAWFRPAVLALTDEELASWYEKVPDLELYRLALSRIRALKAHVLTQPEEALLAQAGELGAQPGLGFTMLNNADLTYPDALDSNGHAHAVTHGSYVRLETSQDRVLRENAYHSVYGTYEKVKNTSAALLAAQMRQLTFFSHARHYASSLEASLMPTEVPTEVYHNLIKSVHRHFEPLHTYMELRKRVLGLDELKYWDIYVPMVEAPQSTFTFDEAADLMLKALAPLGEEYISVVRHALDDRWIDVYETPGKMSGAYSADGHGMKPFILLNFQGKLDDVFTLVHEMGHSMQTWLSNKTQPARYAEYPMFVAEVASTTNECLLLRYLIESSPKEQRAYFINHFCEQFRTTLYRQTMFAEFERDANAACAHGEGVGAEALSERYRALNDAYYGPAILSDDEIALEWARIPHFYYDYYVYVYATSFAAAVSLSERILREGEPAVKDYLAFLSGGCSKSPIELLRGAGVDMASGEVVDAALDQFAKLVGELDALL
jgi:oligoendopeptidase F